MRDFDLIVFGGGNAITVATETAKAGWNVALVEKGPLGGTCPHRGCIPSKLLIAHADVANQIRDAKRFHVDAGLESVDAPTILREVRSYTSSIHDSVAESLPKTLTHLSAHGRFVDKRTIEVDGEKIRSDKIVLATGSRPRVPPIDGLEGLPYWTSDTVFAKVKHVPRSLLVVGGGFVGCELAYFFAGMGTEVTIVQHGPELLPAEDAEIRSVFAKGFKIPARLNSRVTAVAHDGKTFRCQVRNGDGRTETVEAEALLLAAGRVPNTDAIGIEHTDLEPNERGFVPSDEHLKTKTQGFWTLGDVAGKFMFTHAASFEAEYLADQLLGKSDEPIEYGPMPHAVFTEPQIASVGKTEQQLEDEGVSFKKAAIGYDQTTKGRSVKEEFGLCKILIDDEGTILGCHIVGHQASVLLHEVIPVMRWRNHITSLTKIIHVHPSLSEVVRGAARKAAALLT